MFLQEVLKTSLKRLEDVLKTPWRCFCKRYWRHLQNILKVSWSRRLRDVLRCLLKMYYPVKDVFWRCVTQLKMSFWRCITQLNIFVLTKTSWRALLKMKTKDVFKTFSPRWMFNGFFLNLNLNDVKGWNFI